MKEIPVALIPTAEKLASDGPVLIDDAAEEMHILLRMGFAEIIKKFGPVPSQPNRSRKAARDLQAGDILVMKVGGFEQFYKIEEIAHRPDGIHVKAAGDWLPVVYRPHGKVEVSDGYLVKQETWHEYQLNAGGQDALAIRRLTEKTPADRMSDPQIQARKMAKAVEVLLGAESKDILGIARSDKSADDKLRAICGTDRRCLAWDSPK